MGIAWVVARHDRSAIQRTSTVLEARRQYRDDLAERRGVGHRHRLVSSLWIGPVHLSVRTLAEQRHFVLVPLAAYSAAGGDRLARPCPVSGTGPPGHSHRSRS